MTSQVDWGLVQDLFETLAEESPSYREQYLNMVSYDDETRSAVLNLLASHDEASKNNWLERETPKNHFQTGDEYQGFRIEKMLGSGGLSEVYLGKQLVGEGFFALKFLISHYASQANATDRFYQEASLLSKIKHPNICSFHHYINDSERPCLIMEYCEGKELSSWLREGALTLPITLGLLNELTKGLSALHEHGIWHRDLKPDNIIITSNREIKIVDLGIAKDETVKLTKTGMRLGTPSYMAPEQWLAESVDARTDLWALGVITYQALTGIKPFRSDNAMMLAATVTKDVPPPIAMNNEFKPLEESVNEVVGKLLAKRKEDRFADLKELNAELDLLREKVRGLRNQA